MKRLGKYEGLTYLALLVIILPLVVWRLSLARTAGRWSEVRRNEQRIESLARESRSESLPEDLQTQAPDLLSGGAVLDSLGAVLSDTGVQVVRYMPYRIGQGGTFTVQAAEIVLSGRYCDLIRVTDCLECRFPGCRLVSAGFKTVRRKRQEHLQLTLVVDQLIDTDNP